MTSVGGFIGLAAAYLMVINVVAFLAFAIDKRRARLQQWRFPERRLLTLAALGGTIGAIAAARLLRHKTYKEPFRTILRTIGFVQLAVLGLLLIPQVRDAIGDVVRRVLPGA